MLHGEPPFQNPQSWTDDTVRASIDKAQIVPEGSWHYPCHSPDTIRATQTMTQTVPTGTDYATPYCYEILSYRLLT